MTETEKNVVTTKTEADESMTVDKEGNDVQKDNEHQRTINVGNLPKDVTEQQLREHFTGHEVERVEIYHYHRNTLALLLFKDKAAAQKAIDEKDGKMMGDRRLRIHLEYITIRYTKKDVIVTVVDDDMTEEKLYDRVKEHCEVTQVFIFHPLGYVHLGKEADKTVVLEKLNASGLKAYDVNGRDQNQHVDLWRAAKLFFRNRNRVQLLNVPQKWVENTDELKKACSEAGTITEAVANNVNQAASNYYARIFFETEEQAAKAAELLNGKVFEGKRIHALHLSSALLPNYKTSVYASPLEKTVTEEDVYDHFKQFGEIDFVNRRNCVDNAIVCFKSEDAVEKALACTTFPAPTEANKEATKTISVKRYDGPLVLRAAGVKRKQAVATKRSAPDGKTREPRTIGAAGAERERTHKDILQKLQAFWPVYVSNVPYSCPSHVIRDLFSSQGGEVKFLFSPQQYLTYRLSAPQPVKTVMLYYTRRNDMYNALKNLDKKALLGHHLNVIPGRGDSNFELQNTVRLSRINESLSEDVIFRKMCPLGKIVRLTKKSRSLAFVEFADAADVEKILKLKQEELPINCVYSKITKDVNRRLYNESDPRIVGTIVRLLRRNPKMLTKTTGAGPLMSRGPMNVGGGPGRFAGGKRPRMSGPPGFGNPPPFNPNNGGNLNNNQAIQDLLRLAFMSGKNVGESLAAGGGSGNQGPNRGGGGGGNSFNNADPPISNQGGGNNAFGGGDGGFGAGGGGGGGRNMNNRNQNNFRGGNRNNANSNVGGNRGLGGGNLGNSNNNNAGGNSNFGNNQNQGVGGGGGPRSGGGALGGGNNGGGGGGMMNNRNNNPNMNNRNNNQNMNKRGAGGNVNVQQQAPMVGGSIGGNNKGGGGLRGNNQGLGGVGGMGGTVGGGGGGGNNMNMNRSNNNNLGGGGGGMGGGNNRNNRNNYNNDNNSSFGGSVSGGNNNPFGGNNFASDNFGGGRNNNDSFANDNFGGGRNDSYGNDNFGGNSGGGGGGGGSGRNNFGNRNNDNFGGGRNNDNFGGGNSNFGGNSYGSGGGGGGSRFNNDNDGPFGGNTGTGGGGNAFGLNNRGNNSSNSRFSDDNVGGGVGGGGGYGGGNNNRGNNFNDGGNFGNNRGGGNQKPQSLFNLGGGGSGSGGGSVGGNNMSYNSFGGGNSGNSGGGNFRNDNNSGDTFDDERYYQSITPTPALPVPVTIQAVAPATAATTVITTDNTFQSEYIPVPRGDDRYEFAASMMPRDTRMYDPSGLVSSATAVVSADSVAVGGGLSNAPPVVPLSYRGDERHYYPVVSTITSSYLLDNRQYEPSLNSPSMMHDRLYQPTTHTITSGMLYGNERSHYETASTNIAAIASVGGGGGASGGNVPPGPHHPSHLSSLQSANNNDCHAVDIMMRSDASVAAATAAAAAAAASIDHAEASWRAEMMERQDDIDRQYLVLLPREDKIEPQDDL